MLCVVALQLMFLWLWAADTPKLGRALQVLKRHLFPAYNTYIVQGSTSSYQQPYFVSLDHGRAKRDVAAIPQPAPAPTAATTTAHASDDSNRTINTTTISES